MKTQTFKSMLIILISTLFFSTAFGQTTVTIEYGSFTANSSEDAVHYFPNPVETELTIQIDPNYIQSLEKIKFYDQDGNFLEEIALNPEEFPQVVVLNSNIPTFTDGFVIIHIAVAVWGLVAWVSSTLGVGVGGTGVRPRID